MSSNDANRGGVADMALQLVLEMKRNPDILLPYNTDLMRQCQKKIDELYQKNDDVMNDMKNGLPHDPSLLHPRLAAMLHIRRCMMAYVNERKNRIKSYRWKYGGALPPNIRNALCEAEIQFFNEYSSTLARFQAGLGEAGVNLLMNTSPPKTLFVQVRAVEEYGEFETSDGTQIQLTKDSLHSLPRQDCEMLIRQGVLELVH